jgi:hypothetical protein
MRALDCPNLVAVTGEDVDDVVGEAAQDGHREIKPIWGQDRELVL